MLPVSGGEVGAKSGTLSIMVGGEENALRDVEHVLTALGRPIYCGPSGSGQVVKACNQVQVAMNLLGFAEALVIAENSGLDLNMVYGILRSGYAQSRVSDVRGPMAISGNFAPGFRTRLHYKDLAIARETGRALGCSLPGTALAHELFAAAVANGLGDLDHSAILELIRILGGRGGEKKPG